MKNDDLRRRLPPPPLFTIRPPPKPPGSLFEHFQSAEIFNGKCIRPTLNLVQNTSSTIIQKDDEQINWLNLSLLILAIFSVISCIIIAIFIFICLKKLKKEEKEYKTYFMTGSLSSRTHPHPHHHSDLCARTSEHYKCLSNTFNCCDDYYSHQLIPMTEVPLSSSVVSPQHLINSKTKKNSTSIINNTGTMDNSQTHQYECIPEYLLTMTRHHHPPSSTVCHRQNQIYHDRSNTCSVPYATFSRALLLSRGVTTATTSTSESSQCTCSPPSSSSAGPVAQEESSTPLLTSTNHGDSHETGDTLMSSPKSLIVGWTRRNSTMSTKRKSMTNNTNEQKHSFLSQLRKSSVLQ